MALEATDFAAVADPIQVAAWTPPGFPEPSQPVQGDLLRFRMLARWAVGRERSAHPLQPEEIEVPVLPDG
jgi:hypothetical protein